MSVGPIPVSKIEDRGERSGLDSDMMNIFKRVIRAMDNAYLEWVAKQKPK